jgi:hypothetical protein
MLKFVNLCLLISLLAKGTMFSKLDMYPRRVRIRRTSMDTILFLEIIVHFYSYTRHKVLHMERFQEGRPNKHTSMRSHLESHQHHKAQETLRLTTGIHHSTRIWHF